MCLHLHISHDHIYTYVYIWISDYAKLLIYDIYIHLRIAKYTKLFINVITYYDWINVFDAHWIVVHCVAV